MSEGEPEAGELFFARAPIQSDEQAVRAVFTPYGEVPSLAALLLSQCRRHSLIMGTPCSCISQTHLPGTAEQSCITNRTGPLLPH